MPSNFNVIQNTNLTTLETDVDTFMSGPGVNVLRWEVIYEPDDQNYIVLIEY